jgi:hypothetical protein
MSPRLLGFLDCKFGRFCFIHWDIGKYSAIFNYYCHEEQHSSDITSVRDDPGCEHVFYGDVVVQECGCHEHYVGGEEVGSDEDDHYEADKEHECASCAD